MFLPYTVIEQLTPQQVTTWEQHFAGDRHERARSIEEGIWRRTQEPANAELSGWDADNHGRRRVVHYRYQYGLDWTFPVPRLVLQDLYLFHSITAPKAEIDVYLKSLDGWLRAGGWREKPDCWSKGDLRFTLADYDEHPQDERAGRDTPHGFRSVDVCFISDGYEVSRVVRNLPWDVLAGGIRVKEQRGEPAFAPDLSGLLDYLPFQVEVGCGTSIEARIPPLHYLHEVYRVTARKDNTLTQSHAFTMSPEADTLVQEMLLGAQDKAADLVRMFRACFLAEPTPAHHALKALHDAGVFVGPVITHNFDVLSARAGLEEVFVRRYDQKIPPVPLLDEAKALLVVGLHADRRAVQARARDKGMKIFYVDPEGLMENGVFKEYPIEGAREGDVIVREAAIPALTRLCELLDLKIDATS
ncbi:hypothetical protein [Nonomuraea sp. SYSU D8015]|uniref:hypothetical protein n=1 Tax=Nonomuraea sp. SYSU D8015 TaxID=2593644 RepID=UPI0016608080|nr:hypothetical protein [Nonomuraea sp. SYSU D8015]